jgi:hypothetical protein
MARAGGHTGWAEAQLLAAEVQGRDCAPRLQALAAASWHARRSDISRAQSNVDPEMACLPDAIGGEPAPGIRFNFGSGRGIEGVRPTGGL